MSTTHSGSENPTDEAPAGWKETKPNCWVHETRAIVRIRGVIPTRSAAEANAATHSEGATQFEVLFHEHLVLLDTLAVSVGPLNLDAAANETKVEAVSTFVTRGEDSELLARDALRDLNEDVAWPTAVPVGSWLDAELFDTVGRRLSCGHVGT